MNREVELAKRLLESKGYTVSKSITESYTPSDQGNLKYISNKDGYQLYRKIENGKGVWFAKLQDDTEDNMFPITYAQARGYEEMPNPTEIERLQRKLGKMLLPQSESHNYSGHDVSNDLQQYLVTVIIGGTDGDGESGMTEPDYYMELVSAMDEEDAKRQVEKGMGPGDGISDVHLATDEEIAEYEASAYDEMNESSDTPHTEQYKGYSIQSYDDYGATIYKNGKKIREFENIDDAREYIDGLSESKDTLQEAIKKAITVKESKEYWITYISSTGSEESQLIYDVESEEEAVEKFRATNDSYAKAKITGVEEHEIWEPFKNGKYSVYGSKSIGREDTDDIKSVDTDDPAEAIEAWFRINKINPTETSISTANKANAQSLIDWAAENTDKISAWYDKYGCHMKKDYLLGYIQKMHADGIKYFYEGYAGDQIDPFSVG